MHRSLRRFIHRFSLKVFHAGGSCAADKGTVLHSGIISTFRGKATLRTYNIFSISYYSNKITLGIAVRADAILDYVCVFCVFFPSILDIKFVGRTSRGHTGGRSHRIFNPPSFCGACLDFCREKDSAIPFPRRP